MPAEMVSLLNTVMTAAIAIAFTLSLQLALVLAWRKLINRRYYLRRAAKAADANFNEDAVGPERLFFGLLGFEVLESLEAVRAEEALPAASAFAL